MKLYRNGIIHSAVQETAFAGDILVENGKIKQIGTIQPTADMEVINLAGKLVYPGFIDAHCHIGMWESAIGFEGNDGNEASNVNTANLRAIDAINPMDEAFEAARNAGVTTAVTGPGSANVIGGTFLAMKTVGKRIDDMVIKNPIAMKVAFGENPKRTYKEKGNMTRMQTAANLRDALYQAKEYARKLEEGAKDATKMPAYDAKLLALLPVVKKELPLKVHAHRADDIFTAIRICKELDIRYTLEHCTEGHLIADELAKEQVVANVGPSLSNKSKFELKNLTFQTPAVLTNAGIKVAIITDSPVIPLEYLPLCASLAMKSGLPEFDALKAITINAAEITGIADRVGSLEEGKDADFVVLDRPFYDVQANTVMTVIDGEIVYQG